MQTSRLGTTWFQWLWPTHNKLLVWTTPAEAVASLQAILLVPQVYSEELRTEGGKTVSQTQISRFVHAAPAGTGHLALLNLLMRSGQSFHNKVRVLTDKFPEAEKTATGEIAKTDQDKGQRKSNNLVTLSWATWAKAFPKRSLNLITG